ncbi:involucrin-like [Lampris incognitus]|uniref:involucrin-like n=1 Tax=Lampris incognitus TaxID=2546036 RepID=UPI0024B5CBAD|nr:involucrin-like [Lampris incognitus]
MSRLQILRLVVQQRLTAAAEEIFGVFEKAIEEYEEEIDRQRRLVADAVKNESNRPDPQQLLGYKEEVPSEQQEWSPRLVQEEPEPPHIKKEEEDLWNSQGKEQLLEFEERAGINKLQFTPVPVKSEIDEEEAQSLELHQSQIEETSSSTEKMKTEADGEDCGLQEPARNLDQHGELQPPSDSGWNQISEPRSSLDTKENCFKPRVIVLSQ